LSLLRFFLGVNTQNFGSALNKEFSQSSGIRRYYRYTSRVSSLFERAWCRTRIEMSQGKMLSMNDVGADLDGQPSGVSIQ
jgi:hypothetical protein